MRRTWHSQATARTIVGITLNYKCFMEQHRRRSRLGETVTTRGIVGACALKGPQSPHLTKQN